VLPRDRYMWPKTCESVMANGSACSTSCTLQGQEGEHKTVISQKRSVPHRARLPRITRQTDTAPIDKSVLVVCLTESRPWQV
jgi:hypothetical protein